MAFPLQFSPGTRFLDIRFSILMIEEFPDHRVAYTNLGYCALALIIEQVWSDHKVGLFVVQFVHIVFRRSKTTTCPTYQTLTDFSSCPPSPFSHFHFLIPFSHLSTSEIRARDIPTAKLSALFSWMRQVHKSSLDQSENAKILSAQGSPMSRCTLARTRQKIMNQLDSAELPADLGENFRCQHHCLC